MTDFRALVRRVVRTADEKGFWDDERSLEQCIVLIHTELSETIEADREGADSDDVLEELSDVIIRTMDLAGHMTDADRFEQILEAKIAYNETRERKHGKRY